MRRTVALGALLTLALSIVLTAQSAQELYQRALVQEHANGNLTDAIALYAQALQTAGKDRALAAKVLMRIAGAHEKLGVTIEAERRTPSCCACIRNNAPRSPWHRND